jgi:hypothetical protein
MTRSTLPTLVRSVSVASLGWIGIGYSAPNSRSVRPTA